MLVIRQTRRTASGLNHQSGFTILELLAAVAIFAILIAVAVPGYQMYLERARLSRAVAQLGEIEIAINEFATEQAGQLPIDLAAMGLDGRMDPWGSAWVYVNLTLGGSPRTDQNGDPVNSDYDLYSPGPDLATALSLTSAVSADDIVRASDGGFVGAVSAYSRLD